MMAINKTRRTRCSRKRRRIARRILEGLALAGTAGFVFAAISGVHPELFEYAKLEPWDQADDNGFGVSVAIHGETIAAGAYLDDDRAKDAGAVYLFRRTASAWEGLAKLTASDGMSDELFGYRVSLSDSVLAVGAPLADQAGRPQQGAVYVFEELDDLGWVEVAKLTVSGGKYYENVGFSLAAGERTILMGVPWDDVAALNSGSVRVFERQPAGSWEEEAVLDVDGLSTSAFFGESISMSEDTAVIGAYRDVVDGVESGAAYVFERDAISGKWVQQARLTPPEPEHWDRFGLVTAVSADWAAVGNWREDHGETQGSVYLYSKEDGAWQFTTELQAPEDEEAYGFGWSVALEGDQLLVGSYNQSDHPGKVFLFERVDMDRGSQWQHARTLLASDGFPGDHLGHQVAIARPTWVVNKSPHTGGGERVYLFSPEVFEDGFESGDTSRWSSTVP